MLSNKVRYSDSFFLYIKKMYANNNIIYKNVMLIILLKHSDKHMKIRKSKFKNL